MKNKTYITVSKENFGKYYKIVRDVTEETMYEIEAIIDMMDEELDQKIKILNARKPKLP